MRILECQRCGVEGKVADDVTGFTCSYCISEMLQPTGTTSSKKKAGYPAGWKFMKEFVHADGTVYFKGIEQPSLKGTYEVTPIAKRTKVPKKQKEEQRLSLLEEYNSIKKDLKTERRKTYRKKLEMRLNKLAKLI